MLAPERKFDVEYVRQVGEYSEYRVTCHERQYSAWLSRPMGWDTAGPFLAHGRIGRWVWSETGESPGAFPSMALDAAEKRREYEKLSRPTCTCGAATPV